jgi:hypothetical protein
LALIDVLRFGLPEIGSEGQRILRLGWLM